MKRFYTIFVLLCACTTTKITSAPRAQTSSNNEQSQHKPEETPIPQIMASNFINILAQGFAAAHASKEDRVNHVLNALASISTLIQLAFKSKEEADEFYALITHPEIVKQITIAVERKQDELKLAALQK